MISKNQENINITVHVDEGAGRVLASVSLSPRSGRERTLRVTAAMVREWLISEKNIKAGPMISGNAIHNDMSRRLGTRTHSDLQTDFVFSLNVEKAKPAEVKAATKATSKPKVSKPKAAPKVTTTVKVEPPEEKKVEAKKPSATTRTKSTRTRSTRTKKVDK